MGTPRKHTLYANHFFRTILIIALLVPFFSACSTQNQSPNQQGSISTLATNSQPQLIPSPITTLPPLLNSELLFKEGKYTRDSYCDRIFNYHLTTYGPLTIAIADNFTEPQDLQKIGTQVIARYRDLYLNAPIPLEQPLTVFILPDYKVGECSSRDGRVFISVNSLDSRTFLEEMVGVGAGISEYWIQSGIVSLILGEQPDSEVLKNWYINTDDLDMAGLFIARFNEYWASEKEIEIARLSAASLVHYSLDVEKIPPENLAESVNNDVRTRWLESIGVNRTVTYPYDGRFNDFVYSRSSDCNLIVQTDTIRFCLNRLPDDEYIDEISEAEFLIDQSYYGRKVLVDYILAEAPSVSKLMDPDEMITIEVIDLKNKLGYTHENLIVLNWSAVYFYPLHEIVHTFNWNHNLAITRKSVWLSEGFAQYLGMLLPLYQQTEKRCVFEDLTGRVHDDEVSFGSKISYCYCLDSEQLETAKKWYLAQGGLFIDEASTDPRLFADAVAFATMYRDAYGCSRGIPIGEKYKNLIPRQNLDSQEGLELSYHQAASFIAWLCDAYSLDRVLNVYVNLAENGLLDGKSYEELKSAWLSDLLSKGQGIEIPGLPHQ